MATPQEPDFPPGHPARFDYNPASPEAREWARRHVNPEGERDFPVDHPKAVDTEGNTNHLSWAPGVDPSKPHLEPHTGRTPEQAKAARDLYISRAAKSKPTPPAPPVQALNPPTDVSVQRARKLEGSDYTEIFCPACKESHVFDSRRQFNGSMELPTFIPSQIVNGEDAERRCHFSVTTGNIFFYPDSGHALKGQTVELPSVSAMEGMSNG